MKKLMLFAFLAFATMANGQSWKLWIGEQTYSNQTIKYVSSAPDWMPNTVAFDTVAWNALDTTNGLFYVYRDSDSAWVTNGQIKQAAAPLPVVGTGPKLDNRQAIWTDSDDPQLNDYRWDEGISAWRPKNEYRSLSTPINSIGSPTEGGVVYDYSIWRYMGDNSSYVKRGVVWDRLAYSYTDGTMSGSGLFADKLKVDTQVIATKYDISEFNATVSTDTTINGDGTPGNPLGVNCACAVTSKVSVLEAYGRKRFSTVLPHVLEINTQPRAGFMLAHWRQVKLRVTVPLFATTDILKIIL